jgi:hypothetical protein|tara:strand:+ start:10033 stop:11352 length:1320 start_codon:yes stop_codon:yes gene_type:complete
MKTVFLFIHNRAYISDLLRGDYIKYLSSKYKVVIFLHDIDDTHYQSDNIIYVKFPIKMGKFWTLFEELLRKSLIRRFDNFVGVRTRHLRYKQNDWRKNFLKRIAKFLPRNFFGPDFFFLLEKIFVPHTKIFKQYIDKYNPSIILTTTPGLSFMEAWAIICAKKFNIPSVATYFSWDNLTIYARALRKTDYIICWNEIIKKEAIEIHKYKRDETFVSGIIRFDYFFKKEDLGTREEFLRSKGLDPNKKTILIATATDVDPDLYINIARIVKNLDVNMYIRIHPIDRISRYAEFGEDENVYVESAGKIRQDVSRKGWQIELDDNDRLNVKKILKFCDLGINRASTMTLDTWACNVNMPIINLNFKKSNIVPVVDYEHYKPIVDVGAVRVAHNIDEVMKYINMYLNDLSIDLINRKKMFDMLIKFNDGLSYKKSVDFLDKCN